MEAEVTLIGTKTGLIDTIPEAEQRYASEIGSGEGGIYLVSQKTPVEIQEITSDNIFLEAKTPFGDISFIFTPDVAFLQAITEIAIERAERARKILEAGKL